MKAEAEDLFYTTTARLPNASGITPPGRELLAIEVVPDVSGNPIVYTKPIGPMNLASNPAMNAGACLSLARSPLGVLYGVCGPLFGAQYLATIDKKTGLVTQVSTSTTTSGLAVMALAFAPNGVLYAVGDCNPNPNANNECGATINNITDPNYNSLYTVDIYTGAFQRVGSTGAPQLFMDLAFDRWGKLFGVTSTFNPSAIPAVLYSIDTTTGTATKLTNLVGSGRVMGLAFGGEGKLYATDLVQNPGLYLIDMKTGFERAIAALPFPNSSGLELANPY
jgi:hypothetical protein